MDVEIIKEQVLDLNDKFDFLLTLLFKNEKLGVEANPESNDQEFVLHEQAKSQEQDKE